MESGPLPSRRNGALPDELRAGAPASGRRTAIVAFETGAELAKIVLTAALLGCNSRDT